MRGVEFLNKILNFLFPRLSAPSSLRTCYVLVLIYELLSDGVSIFVQGYN